MAVLDSGGIVIVILRLVIMTILEVLKELTSRLGHQDLSEKCGECIHEVQVHDELIKRVE